MFNKPSAKSGARPPAGDTSIASALKRAGPQQCSLLASDLSVEGDVVGEGELLVEGRIKGDVRVSRLIVGKGAEIVGRIEAETVDVRGRVNGDIAAGVIRLLETAHVDGDILHEQLSIECGAFYRGRVEQRNPAGLAVTGVARSPEEDVAAASADPTAHSRPLDPLTLEIRRPTAHTGEASSRGPRGLAAASVQTEPARRPATELGSGDPGALAEPLTLA